MPTKRLMHVTENYRDDEDRRLMRVEAYYRNDTTTGVGAIIEDEALPLFEEMMRDYEKVWEQADAKGRQNIVGAYFSQLGAWGMMPAKDRSNRDNYLCALNIAFLERHKCIQGDRYNGCQFTYEVDLGRLEDFL